MSRTALVILALACLPLGCRRVDSPAAERETVALPPWFEDVTERVGLNFVHDAGPVGDYFMPQQVGSGAALFDCDRDGRLDIYLLQNGGPQSTSTNRLYRQLEDGRFLDVSKGSGLDISGYCMGVAIGDVNNDGWPDVVVTRYDPKDGGVKLFLNNGNGTFADVTKDSGLHNPSWGTSTAFFDYDRDGWLDLVVINYVDYDPTWPCKGPYGKPDYCAPKTFRGRVSRLFHNLGGNGSWKGFADVTESSGLGRVPGPGLGVVCADFDGDDWPDYKPKMREWYDKDLPDSVRKGQRLTTMTSGQARFPIAPSMFKFAQHGKSGMWVSELLPWTAKMVDDMAFIRSMYTEAINHEPAISFMQTGNQVTGRPCLGAWASYGLGSMNSNLPTFVVLVAKPTNTEQVQAISARLWASGYLSGEHAGVSFRTAGDPILYINNPPGVSSDVRRKTLDGLQKLNEMNYRAIGDPETHTRIQQYEMAFRMQSSVPELTDLAREPEATFKMYGDAAKKPGTFANTVLLARRMVERGVRFVQIYHNNWDTHGNVAGRLPDQCRDVDQACYGLIQDLKKRGLYDETLVIWGGEFGRTIYSQGGLSKKNYGRDHHPRCFTMWMAGGGARPGAIHGETDDFSYNIVKDPVHIRDFHATVLQLLGFDHQRFTYRYQGLDQKLTGVEPAHVVKDLLA